MSDIISRSRWGSKSSRGGSYIGTVDEVIIHHSYRPDVPASASAAQERGAIQGIQRYHTDTNGWADIGYSFLVADSGRKYEGRGWHRSGAHTVGKNHSALAFCLIIDGDAADATDAAYRAIGELIEEGIAEGAIKVNPKITGHTDYAAKSCPGGKVYRNMKAKIGNAGSRDYDFGDRTLEPGMKGTDVKAWQAMLVEYDESYLPEYGADGDFGGETVDYTSRFMVAEGLLDEPSENIAVGDRTRQTMEDVLAARRDEQEEADKDLAENTDDGNGPTHPNDLNYDTFPEAYERVESIFDNRDVDIEWDEESRHERLSRIAVEVLLKRRVPGGTLDEQYDNVRDSVERIAQGEEDA